MQKEQVLVKASAGKILVSEPFLLDTYFKRSVILLGEHSEDGSIGFILNKPTDLTLSDALEDFPEFEVPLYFGGPVQTDTIHFIHTHSDLEGCKQIFPGLYWGGNLEMLKSWIERKLLKKTSIRFFAGYAGWEPEQLDEEVKKKTWMLSNGKRDIVLSQTPEELWGTVLKSMGSKYAILANFPEDPSLN